MQYRDIPSLSREQVEAALANGSPEQMAEAILSASLFGENPTWAQQIAFRYANDQNPELRRIALTALSHIGRSHRCIDVSCAVRVVDRALEDIEPSVSGEAQDVADDLCLFVLGFRSAWEHRHVLG